MTAITLQQVSDLLDQKLDEKLDQKLKGFVTKDDLKAIPTKDDLKNELAQQTDNLSGKIGEMGSAILDAVNISTAYRKDLKKLDERVTKIEKVIRTV
ncbi:MAG TPA: hypothetical protein VG965_04725 [Patescibacteria group bacterium]|nr:hypothetical protein [Patescibacteria group bacterium]